MIQDAANALGALGWVPVNRLSWQVVQLHECSSPCVAQGPQPHTNRRLGMQGRVDKQIFQLAKAHIAPSLYDLRSRLFCLRQSGTLSSFVSQVLRSMSAKPETQIQCAV